MFKFLTSDIHLGAQFCGLKVPLALRELDSDAFLAFESHHCADSALRDVIIAPSPLHPIALLEPTHLLPHTSASLFIKQRDMVDLDLRVTLCFTTVGECVVDLL